VLLQNRNAFGHALITDIAGNTGDKPALSENSIPLGIRITARFLDRFGKGIRGAPRDALVADITPASRPDDPRRWLTARSRSLGTPLCS
jgi:hypothetical protein